MKFVKMFLALVGLVVLYFFVKDNMGKVVVKFLDYSTPEIELFLILIITFVLGMIVASFSSTLKIIKLKRQLKHAGTNPAEQTRESKKDKKSKHKKDDADKPESGASSTSTTPSSSGGGYAATGATAAGAAYTTDSTPTAPTPEDTSAEADSPAPEPVKEHEEVRIADETAETSKTEEGDNDVKTTSDEVISLPSDETSTDEEGKSR